MGRGKHRKKIGSLPIQAREDTVSYDTRIEQKSLLDDKILLYMGSARLLPKVGKIHRMREVGDTVKKIHSGLKDASPILIAISAPVAHLYPPAGVALQGLAGTCIAVAYGLDHIVKPINIKNAIIDAINIETDRFNQGLEADLKTNQDDFRKKINQLKVDYSIDIEPLSDNKFSEYEAEAEKLCSDFVSKNSATYTKLFAKFSDKVSDVTKAKCHEHGLEGANWIGEVKSIVGIASSIASSSAQTYVEGQVKEAIKLEEKKLHLKMECVAFMKQKQLSLDVSNPKSKGLVLEDLNNKCNRKDLTKLMIMVREAQKEKDAKIDANDRKYKDFDFLLEIGLDRIEVIRKNKGEMELAGGAFEKLLEKANEHPKATIRMMTPEHKVASKEKMNRRDLDNSEMVELLDKIPAKHWDVIDKMGNEINRREGRGMLRTFILDSANKVANICNNIRGIGVKDKMLQEAMSEFKEKAKLNPAERKPGIDFSANKPGR